MVITHLIPLWSILLLVALLSSVLNWVGVAKNNKRLIYIFKPTTMFLLIVSAYVMRNVPHSAYLRMWFIPALFLSLCGDIFLMFSGNHYFMLGLASFLVAHIFYIIGLNRSLPPVNSWVLVVIVLVLLLLVYPRIDNSLRKNNQSKLRIPTAMYAVVLSMMLLSCWVVFLRTAWSPISRFLIITGGSLFYTSDLMLAWNKFVFYSNRRELLVMMTYQIAQIFLTTGIVFSP